MKCSFLGRGAAFYPHEGNTSAFLRGNGRLLLLDCGESVFSRLIECRALEGVSEVWIAVSHLHSDHCGSLGSLVLYCAQRLGFNAKVLLPDDPVYAGQLRQLIQLFGVPEQLVTYLPDTALQGFDSIDSFRYAPTRHAPGMRCFSFEFETPGGGVLYTADTCVTDGIAAFIRSHPAFERIYTEAIDAASSEVHLPLHQLASLFPPAMRSRVTIMHLNSAQCEAAAHQLGFQTAELIPSGGLS